VVDGGIAFGFGTAIVGGLVAMLVAWPVVVWLMRRGPVTRRTVLLGGLLLGNVPAVLAIVAWSAAILNVDASDSARIDLSYVSVIVARAVPLGSAIGLAGAAVFWIVAREPVQHHLPPPDTSSYRSPH
jgi:voltage-gated potassium channel Kch